MVIVHNDHRLLDRLNPPNWQFIGTLWKNVTSLSNALIFIMVVFMDVSQIKFQDGIGLVMRKLKNAN